MDPTLETSILVCALIGAVVFLFRKKIWKKKGANNCKDGNCNC